MANSSSSSRLLFLIVFHLVWSYGIGNGCYTSIISFGDSLADTGNLKQHASIYHRSFPFFRPPYGETFFHEPTGRCSNGRLVIDFLGTSLGLPLVPPYVGGGDTMKMEGGVNYAVAGATALESWFLEERGVYNRITNASLGVQMGWFKQSLPSFCATDSDIEEYDNTTGCLIRLNKFVEYHNKLLQRELNRVQELHRNVHIVYADYYNAAMQFYTSPSKYGFTNGALKACCGGEGPFNCNPSLACVYPSSTVCAQPNTYANWNGMHLTEVAYKLIYMSVFEGLYCIPQFNSMPFNVAREGSHGFLKENDAIY